MLSTIPGPTSIPVTSMLMTLRSRTMTVVRQFEMEFSVGAQYRLLLRTSLEAAIHQRNRARRPLSSERPFRRQWQAEVRDSVG